ncbi:Prefoldin subunit 4 [Lecanosticta acicola]|uniref:Prefoldin subunit 4 n=1 Tax=Lecanosticta acicola TaxID=111012 RepID=A0AAI8YTP4_9PEZI|nr:Prefoldin subunit 4 [Lecanosticta acicola]
MTTACATCASAYDSPLDPASEKPLLPGRDLDCCGRSICSRCLTQNKRFNSYCPFCQISTEPSLLPQGLRDPPAYSALDDQRYKARPNDDELPAYSEHQAVQPPSEKPKHDQPAEDVLHFVTPDDSVNALALAYGVPVNVLRKTNNIFSDHLLQGRKTILIPGEHYKGGVSLSPQPLEGEEEEIKKNKTRRWMVACKVAEYDVALLYLKQVDWNLEAATEAFKEDERWEKEHPREAKQKMKKGKSAKDAGMRRFVGGSGSAR